MHAVIDELQKDHVNLGKLLMLLEAELHRFRQGESPNYLLWLDAVHYVESYHDLVHHPREDAIFNVYLETNDEAAQIIAELLGQHKRLIDHSFRIRNLMEQVICGSIVTREMIETSLFDYIAQQREHSATEEAQVFSLVDRRLRLADWARIEQMIPAAIDPIFGGTVQKRYQAVYEQIRAL